MRWSAGRELHPGWQLDDHWDEFQSVDVGDAQNDDNDWPAYAAPTNIGGIPADATSHETSSSASPTADGSIDAAATVASVPTLAAYLVSGFWAYEGGQPRHWASNTISVNITGLTAAEQTLATNALELWHEVANISFTFTSGAANITYNHNGGATQYVAGTSDATPVSGQNLTHETIDISTYWFNNDGGAQDGQTGLYSYDFQTYIHETGHALGLGHEGPYNGNATYGTNNIYANDTWQWSIMSYFPQSDYGGASSDYVSTPEMADIYAIQSIYGAASTRTGDTTYGFHSNAGAVFDFSQYAGLGTPAFTIYDTGGNDTLDASGYSNNQTIDLVPGDWSSIGGYVDNIGIWLNTTIENAIGGSGNDTIVGNSADNTLRGNGGNDTIDGGAGTDSAIFSGLRSAYTLTALSGNGVRVVGHDGTDTLTNVEKLVFDDQTVTWPPATQPDLMASHVGVSDTSLAPGHDETISYQIDNVGTGAAGSFSAGIYLSTNSSISTADTLLGSQSFDSLPAGSSISGSVTESLPTTLVSGATYYIGVIADHINQVIESNESNNASAGVAVVLEHDVTGGPGPDGLDGGAGNDVISGNGGDDGITGGTGDDTISGGDGNDVIGGNDGNDTITGDNGNDILGGDNGNDHIDGGAGNDTIFGGSGDDELHGGTGDDIIVGMDGNDTIFGEDGNDIANGGAGNDTMDGGAGNDILGGGADNDVITGGDGDDQLWGEDGNDTINGGAGNDSVDGGAGDDQLGGGAGDDVVVGDDGNDVLFGEAGNDKMNGGAGNDVILGGDGDDQLGGGTGDDVIIGGPGNDTMWGESGSDTFAFAANDGNDLIADFTPGQDHILFTGTTLHSFADVQAHATTSATGATVISYNGGTVTLNGVAVAALHAGDFLFS